MFVGECFLDHIGGTLLHGKINPKRVTGIVFLWCRVVSADHGKPWYSSSSRHIFWIEFHPGRLTWNPQITHLERKMIFQASMIMFHVNLPGCCCFFFPPASHPDVWLIHPYKSRSLSPKILSYTERTDHSILRIHVTVCMVYPIVSMYDVWYI